MGPPPGVVWVLRDVQVYNGNTLTFALQFQLYDAVSDALLIVAQWTPGQSGPFQWQGRIVIPYGESFNWFTVSEGGAAGVDVYVGGYTLSAV
jgi:hypothetical protein